MAQIQTIPQGLTGLLQLKHGGGAAASPASIAPQLVPTFDQFELYAQRQVQWNPGIYVNTFGIGSQQATTGAITTGNAGLTSFSLVGNTLPVTVPQTEMWYVYMAGMQSAGNVASGDVMNAQLVVANGAAGWGSFALTGPAATTGAARAERIITPPMPRAVFVPPGFTFGCFVTDVLSVAGVTMQLELSAVRIPV